MSRKAAPSDPINSYRTPPELFRALNSHWYFDLDPAASHENHLCERYFTEEEDGLAQTWTGRAFVNPPYAGGLLPAWLEKAYNEVHYGNCELAALLIPAKTDTAYWHNHVMLADEIWLFRGRIPFLDDQGKLPDDPPRFPSALVIFNRNAVRKGVTTLLSVAYKRFVAAHTPILGEAAA